MFIRKNIEIGKRIIESIIGCLAVVIVVMQPFSVRAAEGSLCHQHSDSCYENRSVICRDENKVTTHNEDFNCATCGRVASARVVVETYSCKYMDYDREFRRIAYCYSCAGIVQNKTRDESREHSRTERVVACGLTDATVVAGITMTSNVTEWTKDNVVLNVAVTEPVAGQSLAPYSYSFSGGTANGSSCVVDKNGTYSVTVSGKNGRQTTVSLQVNNIDKTIPVIENFYVDKQYPEYNEANLIVSSSDAESGLADLAYSFDGGASFQSAGSMRITSNGNYTVVVQDKAGNRSSKTITVSCFEKKPEIKPEIPTTSEGSSITSPSTIVPTKPSNNVSGKNNTGNENQKETASQGTLKGHKETILPEEVNVKKEELKKRLEISGKRIELKDIPGMYSSVLRTNAEKNAVPTILNIVSESVPEVYSNNLQPGENLVKNISINEGNKDTNGNVAQVSKAVVGAGVLLCIGMIGFLTFFLVKKH